MFAQNYQQLPVFNIYSYYVRVFFIILHNLFTRNGKGELECTFFCDDDKQEHCQCRSYHFVLFAGSLMLWNILKSSIIKSYKLMFVFRNNVRKTFVLGTKWDLDNGEICVKSWVNHWCLIWNMIFTCVSYAEARIPTTYVFL